MRARGDGGAGQGEVGALEGSSGIDDRPGPQGV
jgi:hypothetical protein